MDRFRITHLKCQILVVLVCVLAAASAMGTNAQDKVIQASAAVQESPAKITLSWPSTSGSASIVVYRKNKDALFWGSSIATLPSTATSYEDTSVTAGTGYEYKIFRDEPADPFPNGEFGYVYAGIKVPLVEHRGKLILLVDSTHTATLSTELERLELDLVGDGWTVLRHDVAPADSVAGVKALIQSDYNADTANVKAVFIVGHVAVPYSGNIFPDAHTEHKGAWPADMFYGEVTGTWTDTSVNTASASRSANHNTPGDGKYDQSFRPSLIDLMVGRVDLSNMPAFSKTEAQLLSQYLDKNHNFRHANTTVQARALVDDNLQSLTEGPAATGWRLAALVGAANVSAGDWSTLTSNDYLLAFGCGSSGYTSVGGIASTGDYASNTYQVMFQMTFGSFFGDWDNQNNVLRAQLCNPTYGLTSCWATRPNWHIHHMGLGETIGYGFLMSTLSSTYSTSFNAASVHVSLMGDPTLRLHYVAPASSLSAVKSGANADLSWTASTDGTVLGYHVYRAADLKGPYARITTGLAAGTTYSDTAPLSGDSAYMLRAVRLEQSFSGTYYNASQGIFASYSSSSTPPPAPVITTDGGNGAGVDYVTNEVAFALSGTTSSDTIAIMVNDSTDGVSYTPGSTSWSYSSALTEGVNTFSVTALDGLGNTSTAGSITVTLDTAAPTLSIGGPTPQETTGEPVTFEVTYQDADTITLTEANITLHKTNSVIASVAGVSGINGTTRTVTVGDISGNGKLSISIASGTASDDAGNLSAAAGPSAKATVGGIIFVDFDAAGGGDGTLGSPYNNLTAAETAVSPGGTVRVSGGPSNFTGPLSKSMWIESTGQNVRIGVLTKAAKVAAGTAVINTGETSRQTSGGVRKETAEGSLYGVLLALQGLVTSDLNHNDPVVNPDEVSVYTPVLPFTQASDGSQKAQVDSPLAIRLRSGSEIDPATIRNSITAKDSEQATIEWTAVENGNLRDIWVIVKPQETWYLEDVIEVTTSAKTADGRNLGPLYHQFRVESEKEFLHRTLEPTDAIWQPLPGQDYKTADVHLLNQSGAQATVTEAQPPGDVQETLGTVYAIGPEKVYDDPQRVWLPIPFGISPDGIQLYCYIAQGDHRGWHPAENVEGWLVPDSYLHLEFDQTTYFGFLVRHAGIVQLRLVQDEI